MCEDNDRIIKGSMYAAFCYISHAIHTIESGTDNYTNCCLWHIKDLLVAHILSYKNINYALIRMYWRLPAFRTAPSMISTIKSTSVMRFASPASPLGKSDTPPCLINSLALLLLPASFASTINSTIFLGELR